MAKISQTVKSESLARARYMSNKRSRNFKLGAVQVSLYSRDAIDILVAGLKAFADTKIEESKVSLAAASAAEQEAGNAERQAKTILNQAKAAAEAAKAKAKSASDYYQHWPGNDAMHAAEGASADANAANEAVIAATRDVEEAKQAVEVAKQRYDDVRKATAYYYSAAFYFDYLGRPIQTVETDGDGKFTMEIPQTGAFVIAVQGERNVLGSETERYHWLQPVSLEGRQAMVQNLSNSNLTRATGAHSLVLTQD